MKVGQPEEDSEEEEAPARPVHGTSDDPVGVRSSADVIEDVPAEEHAAPCQDTTEEKNGSDSSREKKEKKALLASSGACTPRLSGRERDQFLAEESAVRRSKTTCWRRALLHDSVTMC